MDLFRHYKNKTYRYRGIVRHSETLEELVHYECRYDNDLGKMWVRPKDLFFGTLSVDGQSQPRFARVDLPVREQTHLVEQDLLNVEALAGKLFRTWRTDKFRQKLDSRKGFLALLAHDQDQLVAFKLGYALSDRCFYSWLGGVEPSYRGVGLGRTLLQMQHRLCRAKGYSEIETKTKNEFKSMLLLNLAQGFVVSGVEGHDPNQLKIILRKSLEA